MEYKVWIKEFANFLQNEEFKRNDEAFDNRMRYYLKQPVFLEHIYHPKFFSLFIAQMQLEQQFGLMIDIVLDWIAAIEARMRKKVTANKPGRPRNYTDNEMKVIGKLHADFYAETNDSAGAWNKLADLFEAKSGDALRVAYMSYRKRLKRST